MLSERADLVNSPGGLARRTGLNLFRRTVKLTERFIKLSSVTSHQHSFHLNFRMPRNSKRKRSKHVARKTDVPLQVARVVQVAASPVT
jgi:hypothetical protein